MSPRRPAIRYLIAAALAALASTAGAGSIEDLTVKKVFARYVIELHARLGAPAAAAYAVFANLANLPSINTDVRQVLITARDADDTVEFYTEVRACVLWYCRSIRETQKMTFVPKPDGGEVYATVLPPGDLRYGQVHWIFRDSGGQTEMSVSAELEPAFRVPPIIGPWIVKRWLRKETEESSANIERLARLPGAGDSANSVTSESSAPSASSAASTR